MQLKPIKQGFVLFEDLDFIHLYLVLIQSLKQKIYWKDVLITQNYNNC